MDHSASGTVAGIVDLVAGLNEKIVHVDDNTSFPTKVYFTNSVVVGLGAAKYALR
jgi:hypothetical protein